jgi:hypothetical protein
MIKNCFYIFNEIFKIFKFLYTFEAMDQLRKKVKTCGLKQVFIAEKVGVLDTHLSLMLSGKATMPEAVRNKLTKIVEQAQNIKV